MERALRLIIKKSKRAASEAALCMQAVASKSPAANARYRRVVTAAFSDVSADFTEEEREIIAAPLSAEDSRNRLLQVRLTAEEEDRLNGLAEKAGKSKSEFVRGILFPGKE